MHALSRQMRLKERKENEVEVFVLEGEIDLHHSLSLRSLLQSKVKAACPALILDLAGVNYIDSSGLAAIMEYMRDAALRKSILCLTCLNDDLKSIFEIVGLDKCLPIFATTAEAANAVRLKQVPPPMGISHGPKS
ncbi:MAG: anti-sigma factor antagonist [Verrucomicrobiota bacterium]|jgi:anti-sigma B factor antagonist